MTSKNRATRQRSRSDPVLHFSVDADYPSQNNQQTNQREEEDQSLDAILESQEYLCDLHTHLLGNGNTGFWIDSIIDKINILPSHDSFCTEEKLRKNLCPLIWNRLENGDAFINGEQAEKFFILLIEEDYSENRNSENLRIFLDDKSNPDISRFNELLENETFRRDLNRHRLSFRQNFTFDVVLTLSDLGKALGVKKEREDDIENDIEEKLGVHDYSTSPGQLVHPFKQWIIFNAREQKFEVVKGIEVATLRKLINVKLNAPEQARVNARARIRNAFSMLSPDGAEPLHVDFDRFHGQFTPEFYPQRFALKDSLYSQRLDILAALLVHVLKRYQNCIPPIRYCELSVGLGDICRPWVFDVLCSFPASQPVTKNKLQPEKTSFRRMIEKGHFLHLRNACPKEGEFLSCTPNVTYKFLAGFKREDVKTDRLQNRKEASDFLNNIPHMAIYYMLEQITLSEKDEENDENNNNTSQITTNHPVSNLQGKHRLFDKSLDDLEKLKKIAENNRWFYYWVVGLDLFGDEMGYPYCPFVAWPFIKYIRYVRKDKNKNFGLRIHCGENIQFVDGHAPAYRHFIAHMYIVFRCLRFLQRKLKYGIRIGHGVAFARILSGNMIYPTSRKSSVLYAEIRNHAKYLLSKIAFEINMMSNEYLLGQVLRAGDCQQTIRLEALIELDAPIILSTDDDGIWPIDSCPSKHPGHHSLVAEYCRAFSSSLIKTPKLLRKILEDTTKFCFSSLEYKVTLEATDNQKSALFHDDKSAFSIIFHPDVIMTLLQKYVDRKQTNSSCYEHYSSLYSVSYQFYKDNPDWKAKCDSMARLVLLSYYQNKPQITGRYRRQEYCSIFRSCNNSFRKIEKIWKSFYYRYMNLNEDQSIPNSTESVRNRTSAERVLYVVCRNASEATTYLHDIGKEFLHENLEPVSIPDNQQSAEYNRSISDAILNSINNTPENNTGIEEIPIMN